MKLDAVKLGLASAIVLAIVWAICSVLVVAIPGPMMRAGGHMIHADLGNMGWSMHWTGFFVGLVLWSVLAGLVVWAVTAVYNRLLD